jgi:hypothetical protein
MAMDEAVRMVAGVVGLLFLAVAIYLAITASWTAAIVFFCLFGGAEVAVYAFGGSIIPSRKGKPD